jgi:hypothetical protein
MRQLRYVCATFALLALLYVGSYYALVEREPEGLSRFVPNYRFGGAASESFFSVWHELDINLRPDYWASTRAPK